MEVLCNICFYFQNSYFWNFNNHLIEVNMTIILSGVTEQIPILLLFLTN